MNNKHAVLLVQADAVGIAISTEDVMGRVIDTVQAQEPFPLNGDRKLRAQAIGKLIALAIEHCTRDRIGGSYRCLGNSRRSSETSRDRGQTLSRR